MEAGYRYDAGCTRVTASAQKGNVSLAETCFTLPASGQAGTGTLTVTPVKPGDDVITVRAGTRVTTVRVFVPQDIFEETAE